MVVELSEELEMAVRENAMMRGVSSAEFVREVLHRELFSLPGRAGERKPRKNAYGILAKYGPAPSAEEIDENAREMFRGFGESFD